MAGGGAAAPGGTTAAPAAGMAQRQVVATKGVDVCARAERPPDAATPEAPSNDSGRTAEGDPAWLAELRAEARRLAGDTLDKKTQELLVMAEDKLRQLDDRQAETTARLEQELRRCQEQTVRLQEDRNHMEQLVLQLQERVQEAEHWRMAATFGQPPFGFNPWMPGVHPQTPHLPVGVRTPPGPPTAHEGHPTDAAALDGYNHEAVPSWPFHSDQPSGLPLSSPPPPAGPESFGDPQEEASAPKSPESRAQPRAVSPDPVGLPPGLECPPGLSSPKARQTPNRPSSPLTPQPRATGAAPHHGMRTPNRPTGATPRSYQSPRTPLTLTPQRPARSSALTSTPMKSPMVPPSPFVPCEGGGCWFGFTLRVAYGNELGLTLEKDVTGQKEALVVTGVSPDGAIAAWNRQCVSGPGAGKEVKVGDRILAVNQTSDAELMLAECREKMMLKFTVARGDVDCEIPSGWTGQPDLLPRDRPLGALHRQAMMGFGQVHFPLHSPPPPPPSALQAAVALSAVVALPPRAPAQAGGQAAESASPALGPPPGFAAIASS